MQALLKKDSISAASLSLMCVNCSEDQAYELALQADLDNEQAGILAERFGIEMIYSLGRRKCYTDKLSRERVVELVNSRIPTLVSYAMHSSCLKSLELAKFVAHPCSAVKQALLSNKNLSREQIGELLEDSDTALVKLAAEELERRDKDAAEVALQEVPQEAATLVAQVEVFVDEECQQEVAEDEVKASAGGKKPSGLIKKILKKVINPKQGDE